MLAALQEEVGDSFCRREFRCPDPPQPPKPASRGPLPLPAPLRPAPPLPTQAADRRGVEASRAESSLEARAAALRTYRRAMGLCYKCGEKWSRDHSCAATVQLHVVQELWELFQLDDDLPELQSDMEAPSDHLFLAISKAAVNGISAARTVRFSGSIQHIPVSILVDSGSSTSFISCQLAAQLSGVQKLQAPVPVQVADGSTLSCTSVLAQAQWFIGEVSFQFDLKVLPLTAYDIIICMDWLEAFSPMTVHWQQKWMQISYEGQSIILQGELPVQLDNLLIQVCVLTDSVVQQSELSLLPLDIRLLVDQFGELFEEPSELPPSRACDHDIPMIPGARPVNIRPYRYPPALRDEIEKQVADMLQKGLMQPSSSSFSSPILLVKKKDGSYRFCVDFRHLNALTMKSKFPVPVFDQLMDELASASWFSNFDLWAGFHQILLKPG